MKYERRHDTVVIFGSHPEKRNDYDWDRTDADVWVFNEAVKYKENSGFAPEDKVAGVFQLHKPVIWKNPHNRNDKNHYEWLQQTQTPVFMQDEYPEIPASVKYPLDEIRETLTDLMLTSSVAQAMALAIYYGYQRMEIYGVEMETNTEYAHQRPGVTFWAGYARGRGMDVREYWKIYDVPIYGFEGEVTIDYNVFEKYIEELTQPTDELKAFYMQQFEKTNSALEKTVTTGLHADGQKFADELKELLNIGHEFGRLDGKRQEAVRYKIKADKMKEVAGEYIFSRQEFESALTGHGKASYSLVSKSQSEGGKFEALFNNMMKTSGTKNRAKRMLKIAPILKEYVESSIKSTMYMGASELNRELLIHLDKMIKAAGGEKSEAVMLEAMRL